jgi:hypothetical protein
MTARSPYRSPFTVYDFNGFIDFNGFNGLNGFNDLNGLNDLNKQLDR